MTEFRGQEYESSGYKAQASVKEKRTRAVVESGQFSVAKVLLWLGLGLLITGVVSLGMPDLLLLIATYSGAQAASDFYRGIMIASLVLILPSVIIINIQAFFRNKGLMITSYLFYTLFMGVFLSSLMMTIFATEPTSFIRTISIAFLVTSAVFLLFGFLGMKLKINHLLLWVVLMSIFGGVVTLSLVSFFLPSGTLPYVSLIITGALLLYMLIMVVLDFNRVKRLAEAKDQLSNGDNLAIYCAYNLYIDFIYIFIRILIFIAATSRRN